MIGHFTILSRLAATAALLVALTGVAAAHAVVVETVPIDGAVLGRAPEHIVVRFNEPVAPISGRVLDAEGRVVTAPGAAAVDGRELRIALPRDLAEGSYVASYRVVSADSHPIGGSIVFSLGQVSAHMHLPDAAGDDAGWRAAMVTVRAMLYGGLLGGAGGVLFLLLVGPAGIAARATERIATVFAATGCAAALAAIGIHGGQLAGGPPGMLASVENWRIGLWSGFGQTAFVATAGLALVAAGLWRERSAAGRPLAILGASIALMSPALSGHVATAEPRWLTIPALIVHAAAVAFWVGALVPLYRAIDLVGKEAAAVMRRFSSLALGAVPLLIVAGLVIAVIQVANVKALRDTGYGLILIAKVGLVAGLLALAALNMLRLTPGLAAGNPRAGAALRRSIAAEIILMTAILVATAALSVTRPPRAIEAEADHAHLHAYHEPTGLWMTVVNEGRRAELSFLSRRSGPNALYVRLSDLAGAPIAAKEVTIVAANPSAAVEPISRAAELSPTGAWIVDGLVLVPAGTWTIRVEALISDFERTRFETTAELR